MPEGQNLALPGNPRYQPKSLVPIFGYDNLYMPVGEVELATLEVLGEIGIIPPADFALYTPEMRAEVLTILTTAVDELERRVTGHDVRAWVRLGQEKLPPPLRRWLHVPNTSYDPLDTARSLQFVRAQREVVLPMTRDVIGCYYSLVTRYAKTLQIGRTHGQHALPITVGFWLATILSRVLYNARMMDQFAAGLVGKISGAVGAYNAQFGLGFSARCGDVSFEKRVLAKLGLKPAKINTQILPPEPLAYYLFSGAMLSAALAQFARDCRHLMRTEIGEIAEAFEPGQVGSSTMAQKRNPITFENIEGMWLRTKNEFGKVFDTLISDHQRDLVGSSVYRDFPIIIVNLVQQLSALLRRGKKDPRPFLERITVDEEACRRNFELSKDFVLAEPIYIALQMAGYEGDAHALVNDRAMPKAKAIGVALIVAVELLTQEEPALKAALDAIPTEVRQLLYQPHNYTGAATEKALEIAADARRFLDQA